MRLSKYIHSPELIQTLNSVENWFTEEELTEKEAMCETIIDLLKLKDSLHEDYGIDTELKPHLFVDIMCTAAYLYDRLYEEGKISTLFRVRERFYDVAVNKYKVNNSTFEGICQLVEGQLGYKCPIKLLETQPGSPNELFNTVVYIHRRGK